MGYEQEKEKRIMIFEDTMEMCREEGLSAAIDESIRNTVLYIEPSEDLKSLELDRYEDKAEFLLTRNRTFDAAKAWCEKYPDKRVGVLNFASATNPGGGVVRGSGAQEECLCRCSTLYPCLQTSTLDEIFYSYHRTRHDMYYTNRTIYTPDINVIKTDTLLPERLSEDERYIVDVVTCPAPNLSQNRYADMQKPNRRLSDKELRQLIRTRIDGIMRVFVKHGVDIPVLGAFGCGAFHNDPVMIAECFKEVLTAYEHSFCKVEFAVYCPPKDDTNYRMFKKVFG